jgi:hypothetical protein
MKRIALLIVFSCMGLVPWAAAQDHVAVGAFVDYFRLHQTDTNFAGVGARLGFALAPHVMLEAEASYDFNQVFNESFNNGGTVTVERSNLRLLHGLIGPKLSLGHANFHPFVTVKGGVLHTRFDSAPATVGSFVSDVENLRSKDLMATFYPGGGLEGRVGPIGLRLDVGDEMYFNHGTHHNLRVAFGPYIRF